jgi:hypothetical protein
MFWHRLIQYLKGASRQDDDAADKAVSKTFRKQYARFRRLLGANAALAELMADMEGKLSDKSPYSMTYVRHAAEQAVNKSRLMARSLDEMSGGKYAGLSRAVERIEKELHSLLGDNAPCRQAHLPVTMPPSEGHTALHDVSRLILPLNLIDPASAGFSPEGCQTLHDVMRFALERSYQEMFAISDLTAEAGNVVMKLKASLPIDLHIIDLGNGTTAPPGAHSVTPEEIVSAPFKALLGGMLRPEVTFRQPRPINMGGFLSVMGRQMLSPQGGERFGDKSYAVVSARSMGFGSRVGYHYTILDSYCGTTDSKNYISFSFQGGAAGEARRERRVRAIALVLEELGFSVTVQGDMLKSRFQKYPRAIIEDRLDQLGRLWQVARQMDMLMVSEEAVVQFRDDFMNGIYR